MATAKPAKPAPRKKPAAAPTAAKKKPAAKSTSAKATTDGPEGVAAFMQSLAHPKKAEMAAVLDLIRKADASIGEGIKWNAPSFKVGEYFATVNVREQGSVMIVLHLGAKVRPDLLARIAVADPDGMLTWHGKDRASLKFSDMAAVKRHGKALQAIVRQWITFLA